MPPRGSDARTAAVGAAIAAVLMCAACTSPREDAGQAQDVDRSPSASQRSPSQAEDRPSPSLAAPWPLGSPGTPAVGPPVPDPKTVDRRDATAVAIAAAIWLSRVDTTMDASWYDAELRTTPFFTPRLVAIVAEGRPHSGPGREWLEWWEHRAYTEVAAEFRPDAQQLADTVLTAYRAVAVDITPIGRDGWRGPRLAKFRLFTLTRNSPDGPWHIDVLAEAHS